MADNRTSVNPCGEVRTFYPGVEDIVVECELPAGHAGPHHDGDLWEWSDDDD